MCGERLLGVVGRTALCSLASVLRFLCFVIITFICTSPSSSWWSQRFASERATLMSLIQSDQIRYGLYRCYAWTPTWASAGVWLEYFNRIRVQILRRAHPDSTSFEVMHLPISPGVYHLQTHRIDVTNQPRRIILYSTIVAKTSVDLSTSPCGDLGAGFLSILLLYYSILFSCCLILRSFYWVYFHCVVRR